jgi:repressor LexA
MKVLTKRQDELLQFTRAFLSERKFPPTFREIADHFGMTVRGAYDHFKALERKGIVQWDKNRSRSLEIIHDSADEPAEQLSQIPILGTVVAGLPLLSAENLEGYLPFPAALLRGANHFALRVKGDSMINAGIHEGDLAIIRSQNTANNGDIVVAMIDDGITLKRFFLEANRVQLKAENPHYPAIYTRDVRILGKLAQLHRSY